MPKMKVVQCRFLLCILVLFQLRTKGKTIVISVTAKETLVTAKLFGGLDSTDLNDGYHKYADVDDSDDSIRVVFTLYNRKNDDVCVVDVDYEFGENRSAQNVYVDVAKLVKGIGWWSRFPLRKLKRPGLFGKRKETVKPQTPTKKTDRHSSSRYKWVKIKRGNTTKKEKKDWIAKVRIRNVTGLQVETKYLTKEVFGGAPTIDAVIAPIQSGRETVGCRFYLENSVATGDDYQFAPQEEETIQQPYTLDLF